MRLKLLPTCSWLALRRIHRALKYFWISKRFALYFVCPHRQEVQILSYKIFSTLYAPTNKWSAHFPLELLRARFLCLSSSLPLSVALLCTLEHTIILASSCEGILLVHIIIVSVIFPIFGGFFGILISYRSLPFFLIEHSALLVVTPLLSFSFSLFFTFAQFGFSCTHNNNRCHTSFFSMSRLLPVLLLIINDCEFSARCWLSQRPRS